MFKYILAMGFKRGFAVERLSVLPDHVHLIIEVPPALSIEECVLGLMNNTAYWMTKNYSGVLKQTGAPGVGSLLFMPAPWVSIQLHR